MAKRLYRPDPRGYSATEVSSRPAIAFYLAFIVGVMIFAVSPAMKTGDWTNARLYAALFGFFSCGVYDFTNWAQLRNWNWQITQADVCWGTVLTGAAASLGYPLSTAGLKAMNIAN